MAQSWRTWSRNLLRTIGLISHLPQQQPLRPLTALQHALDPPVTQRSAHALNGWEIEVMTARDANYAALAAGQRRLGYKHRAATYEAMAGPARESPPTRAEVIEACEDAVIEAKPDWCEGGVVSRAIDALIARGWLEVRG